jgi:hypothetical protein
MGTQGLARALRVGYAWYIMDEWQSTPIKSLMANERKSPGLRFLIKVQCGGVLYNQTNDKTMHALKVVPALHVFRLSLIIISSNSLSTYLELSLALMLTPAELVSLRQRRPV